MPDDRCLRLLFSAPSYMIEEGQMALLRSLLPRCRRHHHHPSSLCPACPHSPTIRQRVT